MNRKNLIMAVLIAFALVGCATAFRAAVTAVLPKGPVPVGEPTAAPEGEGWIDLLSAENASKWENVTDEKDIFAIEGDTLHIFGKTIFPLRYVGYTGREFDNFELHLEYKVANNANSGLFLRTQPNDPVNRGFEVQVLEDYGKPPSKNSAGSIYDVVTPMYNMSRPAGEWNSFDIVVDGHKVTIIMNGWLVIDTDFSKMTEPLGKFEAAYADMNPLGTIALQDHGGETWYRNIYVRSIGPDESEVQE